MRERPRGEKPSSAPGQALPWPWGNKVLTVMKIV